MRETKEREVSAWLKDIRLRGPIYRKKTAILAGAIVARKTSLVFGIGSKIR
jgi:hypothetical protein